MSPQEQPAPLTSADLVPIIERLDAIIALIARAQPAKERLGITERIRMLSELGLDNVVIARITGKRSNYVGAVLGPKTKKRAVKGARRARKK